MLRRIFSVHCPTASAAARFPRTRACPARLSSSSSSSHGGDLDGDEEPLLDLATSMVQASAVSYPLTFILREAKAGNLHSSDAILEKLHAIGDGDLSTYLLADDILDMARNNMDYIKESYGGDVSSWMNAFERFREEAARSGDPSSISMLEFDDHAEHSRLVYGIGLNKIRKRVTVLFRGTYAEGTRDWKRNLQYDPCRVDIPREVYQFGKDLSGLQPFMQLHTGFYEYLFRNSERGAYELERYEEIVANIVEVLRDYPDYTLHICGHSLGGSLALLLSFFLASSDAFPQIPKPITCISVGSPCVGDQTFLDAFQVLERARRIQHLRITNRGDPISHLPPFSWYRHVGLNLLLEKEGGHQLLHPGRGAMIDPYARWKALLNCAASEPTTLHNNHSLAEYLRRLSRERVAAEEEGGSDNIASRCLGDFYSDESIVLGAM